jgi:hypothetical protein
VTTTSRDQTADLPRFSHMTSRFLEHVRGPMLRGALLCARCGQVLWIAPPGCDRPPWPDGCRMVSDGTPGGLRGNISGWPYTSCEPWTPQVGDLPAPASTPDSQDGRLLADAFPAWLAVHGVLLGADTPPDSRAASAKIDLAVLQAAIVGLMTRRPAPAESAGAAPVLLEEEGR